MLPAALTVLKRTRGGCGLCSDWPSFQAQAQAPGGRFPGLGLGQPPLFPSAQVLVAAAHNQDAIQLSSWPFKFRTSNWPQPAFTTLQLLSHEKRAPKPCRVSDPPSIENLYNSFPIPKPNCQVRVHWFKPLAVGFVESGCEFKTSGRIHFNLRRKWRKPSSWLRPLFQSAYTILQPSQSIHC